MNRAKRRAARNKRDPKQLRNEVRVIQNRWGRFLDVLDVENHPETADYIQDRVEACKELNRAQLTYKQRKEQTENFRLLLNEFVCAIRDSQDRQLIEELNRQQNIIHITNVEHTVGEQYRISMTCVYHVQDETKQEDWQARVKATMHPDGRVVIKDNCLNEQHTKRITPYLAALAMEFFPPSVETSYTKFRDGLDDKEALHVV